jgi:hypothetical protein
LVPGEIEGVGTFKVYTAVLTPLASKPFLHAFAFRVVDTVTATGLEYTLELSVGSVPSVVYRIVVPEIP